MQEDFLSHLNQQYILPIIRLQDSSTCLKLCQILYEVGFPMIEITLTTPDAFQLIETLSQQKVYIGAGTVTSSDEARRAIFHGAQYLISPGLNLDIQEVASETQIPYMPGVFTPTEVLLAKEAGLKCLKLFPASSVGPEYLKHLKGPYPDLRFLVTGGIQFEDIPAYMAQGAWAIGQGTRLISKEFLEQGQWDKVTAELIQIKEQVKKWKTESTK